MKLQQILKVSSATAVLGLALVSQPVLAQDTDATGDSEVVTEDEPIVVTGSRIVRPNLENSTPTVVLGQQALEATNAVNVADVLNQYPQFNPSFGTSRTQSTFSGAASSGLNLINLRNLGGSRTLTLLNGRRIPAGTTTSTAVDFNMIPSANIARLEVITGGASAIYGADAVAGVVNIITKKDFEGLEVGASYGITERGDDASPKGYALFGSSFGDGGHILFNAEVSKQGEVICRDRFICAEDFAWFPPAAPVRGDAAKSGVGIDGRFFVPDNPAIAGDQSFSLTRTEVPRGALGSPFSTVRDGFNRNAVRTLAQDTERFLFAADAEYPITDSLNAFIEGNYGLARTQAAFEGHPFQSNAAGSLFGGGPGVAGLQANIPINNPFIPTAFRNAVLANNPATTEIIWWDRFQSLSPRGATNERQMFRMLGGLNTEFDVGLAGPWRAEVSYLYGQTKLDSLARGLVSTRNLYYGLRVEPDPAVPGGFRCADAGARAVGCIPLNVFDGFNAAEQNALNVDAGQSGRHELKVAQAFVSGDLFALPGGNLGVAAGVEHRSQSGFLDYDAPINNAETTGNQIGDIDEVETITKEAFVEAIAPIFGGLPWLNEVVVEGAYRFSDPNRGESYETWRYGGSVEFIPGLRIRAIKARAVRVPNPGELSGIGQNFGVVNDPCAIERRNTGPAPATRAANCTADGVPANYDPPLSVRQSVAGFVGGNPDLRPEIADTLTYGITFAPQSDGPLGFLNGLTLTVDRFEIEMDDVINTVGRQLKADKCYDTTERLFCEDVLRATDPLVIGPIALDRVDDQLINVAAYVIKGYDVEARYGFGLPLFTSDDQLSLQAVATIYDRADLTPLPGNPVTDLLGKAGGSTSDQGYIKFTANGNFGFRSGGTGVNWNVRYIGKAGTSPFATDGITIGDRFYHNVRLSQAVGDRFEAYMGVNNIADSDPPFFPSGTAGTQALDTIPAYYDIFGRSYYVGVKLKL